MQTFILLSKLSKIRPPRGWKHNFKSSFCLSDKCLKSDPQGDGNFWVWFILTRSDDDCLKSDPQGDGNPPFFYFFTVNKIAFV
ncbi:protein of unknown function [Methanocaldococcus lauensis]|nr:protein of unknown function [Methanocaldococcus lauensis]